LATGSAGAWRFLSASRKESDIQCSDYFFLPRFFFASARARCFAVAVGFGLIFGRFAPEPLELPVDLVERVRLAGILHDVGKIAVPDAVLSKPGKLTDAEWTEMRKHPEVGALIVDGAELKDVAAWVGKHHERPDGKGYPAGLAGEEIPLEARILSVADAYEAMTCDRVYRRALPVKVAREELRKGSGKQFDPRVAEVFLEWLEEQDRRGESVENDHFASLVRGLADRNPV